MGRLMNFELTPLEIEILADILARAKGQPRAKAVDRVELTFNPNANKPENWRDFKPGEAYEPGNLYTGWREWTLEDFKEWRGILLPRIPVLQGVNDKTGYGYDFTINEVTYRVYTDQYQYVPGAFYHAAMEKLDEYLKAEDFRTGRGSNPPAAPWNPDDWYYEDGTTGPGPTVKKDHRPPFNPLED